MKKDRCALAYANAPLDTQWGKRILSTLLAVVLCLGLLPGAAFAVDTGTYTHADVNNVLQRVVTNDAEVKDDADKAYDKDNDGKLTSWDAKLVLDDVPAIKVNAMRLTTFDGDEETSGGTDADWVSLEIKDGTLTTTTINQFSDTILDLFNRESAYPVAGALNEEKLVVRMSYNGDDSLIQADPDSFVARKLTLQSDEYGSNYSWYDATTLSDGRLLSVYQDPTSNDKVRFSLMDGEKVLASSAPENAPYLKGIAATGEKDGDSEILYGITEWGDLYRFTLTETPNSDGQTLSIGGFEKFGVLDGYNTNDKYLSSTSLLYDTASGYLLAAVTYRSSGVDTSALYLIDPDDPNDYVTVDLPVGVELNSLYQYEQKSTEGVQLYLSENAISLKAGENADLPTVDAYSYRTDPDTGLVTNSKLGDNDVKWTSSDSSVVTIAGDSIKAGEVTKQTTVTLTATATDTIDGTSYTAKEEVTVTVNPDTGTKVGALIDTSSSGVYVWATIDLDNLDATSDVELVSDPITDTIENKKGYQSGGGYAQGLLWGNYYRLSGTIINPIYSYYYYTLDVTTYGDEKTVSETDGSHKSNARILDLSDSPKINDGISYDAVRTEAKDLAHVVFVNGYNNIAWLTGTGARDSWEDLVLDENGDVKADDNGNAIRREYSAIAYVGDLTAAQVLANKGVSSLQCDPGSTCHVYYALTTDGTLRQVILVPRAGDLGYTGHRYSLCGTDLGKVTFNNDESTTTSMDFLWKDADHYGLLVARSDKSIQYIELKGPTSGTALTASLVGNLTKVTLKDGTTTDVNGVSALYHTGDMTLDEADILRIAGWSDVQASQSAPVAAPAISVLSDDGANASAEPTTPNTITVPITADKDATNGKWTVKYDTKLTFASATPNDGIVYYKTYDNGNGTVTLAFASRSAIEKDNVLFTLTFTGDGSAEDVKITCDELNEPARTPSGGGGGGGGSTGTDSAVALPSGVTGGSVSSSTDKAKPGDTVTITVEPDEGYVPGTVKVVDKDGKEIAVKDLGNGTYSFVMPTGKVDVQVTFAPATGGFADVPTDAYYREAVLWAVEKGVTNGVSDTLFGPDRACTRAQIVTFLYRAMK